ncbi:DUF952 domain-containing protein [Candidatus Pelagibacter sp.]|nr:DUF952 domain-containing protein [Candidatus Pelagibacter sp.]
MELKFIYKICAKNDWLKIKKKGQYKGSKKDLEDGYIHFSGEDQVKETLIKYYSKKENLVLLKVDAFKLENLLWEQASDGNMFPHLYSALDVSNVVDEIEITLSDDGSHILPENF